MNSPVFGSYYVARLYTNEHFAALYCFSLCVCRVKRTAVAGRMERGKLFTRATTFEIYFHTRENEIFIADLSSNRGRDVCEPKQPRRRDHHA